MTEQSNQYVFIRAIKCHIRFYKNIRGYTGSPHGSQGRSCRARWRRAAVFAAWIGLLLSNLSHACRTRSHLRELWRRISWAALRFEGKEATGEFQICRHCLHNTICQQKGFNKIGNFSVARWLCEFPPVYLQIHNQIYLFNFFLIRLNYVYFKGKEYNITAS